MRYRTGRDVDVTGWAKEHPWMTFFLGLHALGGAASVASATASGLKAGTSNRNAPNFETEESLVSRPAISTGARGLDVIKRRARAARVAGNDASSGHVGPVKTFGQKIITGCSVCASHVTGSLARLWEGKTPQLVGSSIGGISDSAYEAAKSVGNSPVALVAGGAALGLGALYATRALGASSRDSRRRR